MSTSCTTGLPGLDKVLKGVLPGDNIVWQVESWQEYRDFVVPYAEAAHRDGKRLIYFRFASHPELLTPGQCYQIHSPDPAQGFEGFVNEVHDVITHSGEGSVCVFDCLSELSETWRADSMLGNFFMLTCPRLLAYQRLAYFAIYRHTHSQFARTPIYETTQFMLDVFSHHGQLYIRPLKVQYRSGEVLNHIHMREGDDFRPVESSAEIAEVLRSSDWRGLLSEPRPDRWKRLVLTAKELLRDEYQDRPVSTEKKHSLFEQILLEMIGEDPQMHKLAREMLILEDLLAICNRLIGSGRIGGKAAGMIIARGILRQREPDLHQKLEAHDSFHVGSEIYYTFLIQNQVWWIRQQQRDSETFLEGVDEAKVRILNGTFPQHTIQQFRDMLSYFGEAPFIVRSSSLLEDGYGNAFAGKYESIFCVNQGPPEARLEALLDAIRQVYASALDEEALRYRKRRGLLHRDEQMALLLQRVSGQRYGRYYYPQLAGVGLSYNPYVWHRDIDPGAGVIRLVFGLGTRAVDSNEDDHTRVIALNAPDLQPSATHENTQRKMDALDLSGNRITSGSFDEMVTEDAALPLQLFTSCRPGEKYPRLTFKGLLHKTELMGDLRRILEALEQAYGVPVDVEFSVNFLRNLEYRINILQCRPFQIRNDEDGDLGVDLLPRHKWIDAKGPVIGVGLYSQIDRVILVKSEAYSMLTEQKQHGVAKAIGRLNRLTPENIRYVLIGSGRWGSREPSLGVPVRFGDINRSIAILERIGMHDNLVPDASLGTHFLNELIECEILYAAVSPGEPGNVFHLDMLFEYPSILKELLPETDASILEALHVVDLPNLHFRANVFSQQVELFQT
ncbi:PEP/pyruvate-binding domain-containing protein [Kiritimatiellaeota bacterium B1221]|nr:PEP/pyruvate-binding domain-containing protein [Kiritimatiellaeota bacterium B1221]